MIIGEWKMQNENQLDASDPSVVASLSMGSSALKLRLPAKSNTQCDIRPHFALLNLHYSLIILFFVSISIAAIAGGNLSLLATAAAEEPFRPEPGKFPPADKAKAYTGELVFVDHANRRGSLRIVGDDGQAYGTPGTPFAMLPYGMIRYHGAPADLRDIPLGSVLHGRFYLPTDPKLSSVPNLSNRGMGRAGKHPAENHAILLEDEPSFCLREDKVWKLKQIELKGKEALVIASREPKDGGADQGKEESMTLDATTRFWRGREKLLLKDLIDEGIWPAQGKHDLGGQAVLLGLTWQPIGGWGNGNPFNRYHISDVWLDETAMQRATEHQTEVHTELIRGRWMPAWVDHVEYGKAGHATVTATLFGGMDASLYADFKPGTQGQMGAAEFTLKHSDGAAAGHKHMAIRGPILDVKKIESEVPPGSSGIQIRFKVDLVLEGFRPGKIVRIRPMNWPDYPIPREEFIGNMEERFPSPDIFPKY
jgi:hypothetical protein